MIKRKSTYIIIALVLLLGWLWLKNINLRREIDIKNEDLNQVVTNNIKRFLSPNEEFSNKYSNIVSAREAYEICYEDEILHGDENKKYLKDLLYMIEDTMVNDINKFNEAFKDEEVQESMRKISENYDDMTSAVKVYKSLSK